MLSNTLVSWKVRRRWVARRLRVAAFVAAIGAFEWNPADTETKGPKP